MSSGFSYEDFVIQSFKLNHHKSEYNGDNYDSNYFHAETYVIIAFNRQKSSYIEENRNNTIHLESFVELFEIFFMIKPLLQKLYLYFQHSDMKNSFQFSQILA